MSEHIIGKVVLTALAVILAVPGLLIEPGPFSEMAVAAFLINLWSEELGLSDEEIPDLE